jgi:orotate phosphoribosyltransferase-like protein
MLTNRQKEILNLIKQGLNNDEIAKKLNITYNTVRSHKKSINRKLKEDMDDPLSNEKFECDFKENSGSINSLSSRLKSVDEVIKFSGIDESE